MDKIGIDFNFDNYQVMKRNKLSEKLEHTNLYDVLDENKDVESLQIIIDILIQQKRWHYIVDVLRQFPKNPLYDDFKISLINTYKENFYDDDLMYFIPLIIDDTKKEIVLRQFVDILTEEKERICFVIVRFNSDEVKKRLFREYKEYFDGIDFSDYLRYLKSDDLRLSEFNEFSNEYETFRIDWIASSFTTDEKAIQFFEEHFDLVDIEHIPFFIQGLESDNLKIKMLDKYYKYVPSDKMWYIASGVKEDTIRYDLLNRYITRMTSADIKQLLLKIKDTNKRLEFLDKAKEYLTSDDFVAILNEIKDYDKRNELINKYLKYFNSDNFFSFYLYTSENLQEKFLDTYIEYFQDFSLLRIYRYDLDIKGDYKKFLKKYLEHFNPNALSITINEILRRDKYSHHSTSINDLAILLISIGKEKKCLKLVYNAIALANPDYFLENLVEDYKSLLSNEDFIILKRLFDKNKHLFSTFIFEILEIDELKNNFQFLEKVSKYSDVASKLCSMYKNNKKKTQLLMRMLDYFFKQDVNLDTILMRLIEELEKHKYDDIINVLDFNSIDLNLLERFMAILLKENSVYKVQRSNNISLPLKELDDLLNYEVKYDYLVDNIFSIVKNERKLKNCIFNKYFGIDIDIAEKIVSLYGVSLDKITNTEFDYVKDIRYVLNLETEEELRRYYKNAKKISLDNQLLIDQKIKKIFNENISSSLLKLDTIKSTKKIKYKEKEICLYVPTEEFNLLVHSVVAYKSNTIDNYQEFWNQNKLTTNHGICCSLITNQNIFSTAPVNDVLFGFDGFSNKAIQLMDSIDIVSDSKKFDFNSVADAKFMLASDLRDYTRHHHNELVLERLELRENRNQDFKNIQPSYVVLYDTADPLKVNNSMKAAYEFNIPIVYINTKEIAKREREEIRKLWNAAIHSLDVSIFAKMLIRRENNFYSFLRDFPEYNEKYFSLKEINGYIKSFYEQLYAQFELNQENFSSVLALFNQIMNILKLEKEKRVDVEADGQIDLDNWINIAENYIQKMNQYQLESKYSL